MVGKEDETMNGPTIPLIDVVRGIVLVALEHAEEKSLEGAELYKHCLEKGELVADSEVEEAYLETFLDTFWAELWRLLRVIFNTTAYVPNHNRFENEFVIPYGNTKIHCSITWDEKWIVEARE